MPYSFLASPYSDPNPKIRHRRYEAAKDAVTWLLSRGTWSFSPIVYCHPLALENGLQTDAQAWSIFNQVMIEGSDHVFVLLIEGWQESLGVQREIALAKQWDKPLLYMRPHGAAYRLCDNPFFRKPLKKSSTERSQVLTQGGDSAIITPKPPPSPEV